MSLETVARNSFTNADVPCCKIKTNPGIVGNCSNDIKRDRQMTLTSTKPVHKILHYGSRHVIQNAGWTTRLTKELPQLKPLSSLPPACLKHDTRGLGDIVLTPALTSDKSAIMKFNLNSLSGISNSNALCQLINTTSTPNIALKNASEKQPQFMPPSGGTFISPMVNGKPSNSVTSDTVRPTILTMPSSGMSTIHIEPPIFIAPANAGISTVRPVLLTVPPKLSHVGTISPAVGRLPSSLPNIISVSSSVVQPSSVCFMPINMPAIVNNVITPSCGQSVGSRVVSQSEAQNNGLSISSCSAKITPGKASGISTSKTVKTLAVFTSPDNIGVPDIRVLNTQVRISSGVITEVNELSADPEERALSTCAFSSVNAENQASNQSRTVVQDCRKPKYLTDCNGAKFGYYETPDGKRFRIAHDTCGQRYSPVWLIPPSLGPVAYSDVSVEISNKGSRKDVPLPSEAAVSGVTTVFTYEPLFVSEDTLLPISDGRAALPTEEDTVTDEGDGYYAYRCYMCRFWSSNKTVLAQHWLNVHMPGLQYCCPYCDRKFFTNVRAQMHVQHNHSAITPSPTVLFRRSTHFASMLSFQLVNAVDADEDDDDENGCVGGNDRITFEQIGALVKMKELVFACRKCNFHGQSADSLRQHSILYHASSRLLHCEHCPTGSTRRSASFSNERELQQHVNECHPDIAKQQSHDEQSKDAGNLLRADIPWSDSWEEIAVSNVLQCRRCTFHDHSKTAIWSHVLRHHKWPKSVVCPGCFGTVLLGDEERKASVTACSCCDAYILLTPASDSQLDEEKVQFVCNICRFSTPVRENMTRHVKYNHTKCRPYACSYCNYVGVEKSKVLSHCISSHPNEPVIMRDRTETNNQFLIFINLLFRKLVTAHLVTGTAADTEPVAEQINASDDEFQNSSDHLAPVNSDANDLCDVDGQGVGDSSSLYEYFKCKVCGYCCTDRSCMSRHVKYMHITARPHSCPYCSYNNVEKTKIRLHVKAHHPDKVKSVCTNRKLLEEMTMHAKKFYTRVDRNGLEPSGRNATRDGQNGVIHVANAISSIDSCNVAPLKLLNGEIIHIPLETFKNEDENVAIDDDDVEFEIKPDWVTQAQQDSNLQDSFIVLDHNYFSFQPADSSVLPAESGLLKVKDEPMDIGYEDCSQALAVGENKTSIDIQKELPADVALMLQEMRSCKQSLSLTDYLADDMSPNRVPSDEAFLNDLDLAAGEQWLDNMYVKNENDSDGKFSARQPSCNKRKLVDVNWKRLRIDEEVKLDPKLQMKASVELEDVLQIILAFQSGNLKME